MGHIFVQKNQIFGSTGSHPLLCVENEVKSCRNHRKLQNLLEVHKHGNMSAGQVRGEAYIHKLL